MYNCNICGGILSVNQHVNKMKYTTYLFVLKKKEENKRYQRKTIFYHDETIFSWQIKRNENDIRHAFY